MPRTGRCKMIDPMIIIDRATWSQAVAKWPELYDCTCYCGFRIIIVDGPPKIKSPPVSLQEQCQSPRTPEMEKAAASIMGKVREVMEGRATLPGMNNLEDHP